MAQKLFLGAFSMVLVNLILALQDQEGYNFNELNSQHGINYLVPPLQNQKEEQLESPPSIQAGLNERYGTQNYVPPSLTGQEQWPQFNQNPLRQYTNNQLSGQKDLLPQAWINTNDLQQFSSNQIVRSGQENLSPPGSNQYLTQEDVPPPAPPSSNVLSGQNFLPVPGSNQFGSQQDKPPPVPPGSNVLSGQNFLPIPGSNQYLTQEDVPPPALPNSNVLSGQNFLPVPGSNQLATQEDVPLPVPPSSNALPGQDVLPPLGGNQLPMGEYVPPPVPPSSNQLGSLRLPEINQFPKAQDLHLPPASDILSNKGSLQPPSSNALKESNQVYGLEAQQQLTDPRLQKPYGNDIVPLPDNNQFVAGDMHQPVNPNMQVPFGWDSSAPGPVSNAFDEDKSEDSASSLENGFISPSKSMDVAMGDSEVEDESYDQEKNDFGSSESFEGSFYSSVLKGLGDVGEENSLDSEYNSYDPLSLGSWNAESSYGSEEQNQGEISEDDSFSSDYLFSSQKLSLPKVTKSEFVGIILDKLQNGQPLPSRGKRAIQFIASYNNMGAHELRDSADSNSLHDTSVENSYDETSFAFYKYSLYDNSKSDSSSNDPDAYESYSGYEEYDDAKSTASLLNSTTNITSNVNYPASRDANFSSSSTASVINTIFKLNSSYSSYDAYSSGDSSSYSVNRDSDDFSSSGGSPSSSDSNSELYSYSGFIDSDGHSSNGGSALSDPNPEYSFLIGINNSDGYLPNEGSASLLDPNSEYSSYSGIIDSDEYSSSGGSASSLDSDSEYTSNSGIIDSDEYSSSVSSASLSDQNPEYSSLISIIDSDGFSSNEGSASSLDPNSEYSSYSGIIDSDEYSSNRGSASFLDSYFEYTSYSGIIDSDEYSSNEGSGSLSGSSSEYSSYSGIIDSDEYSASGGLAALPDQTPEYLSLAAVTDSNGYVSNGGSALLSSSNSKSYSSTGINEPDEYSSSGGSASLSDPNSELFLSTGTIDSDDYSSSDNAPSENENVHLQKLGWNKFFKEKGNKDTSPVIVGVIHTLMGNGKESTYEYSSAANSNALPTDSSLVHSSFSLLDFSTDKKKVTSFSVNAGAWSSGFGSTNSLSGGESGHSHKEPNFNVVTGDVQDQGKDHSEGAMRVSTTTQSHLKGDNAIDHTSFPPQGTGWKPSGTGNIAPEKTAASYPQRTKLLPMGTSSRTDNTPLPNTLAVYCIPVVLLLLLLFLIRSNSYFHRTPKVVIVDPESRNRDIDAKAKEIEPLLRESMEYKDEVN